MAVAMWGLGGSCCAGVMLNTVHNLTSNCMRNKRMWHVSLFKTCLTCTRNHVTFAARQHGMTSMFAACLWWKPAHIRSLAEGGCARSRALVFSDKYVISKTSYSPLCHTFICPHKHALISYRSFSSCKILGSRTLFQTESKTQADDKLLLSRLYNPNTNTTIEGKLHDRLMCTRYAKPEKKENIRTIPNLLTTLRMASAPVLGCLVTYECFGWALSLFAIAGITDMLDGYIARNFPNQTSALGSALDPLADKLLVTTLTVSLTSVGLIPLPLTMLIVFRDVSLIAGGFYIRYRSLPPPITLSRYFDISHATVSLSPTFISKLNTGLQLTLVACSLAAPVFGFMDHVCLQALWWTTGATTFMSGADYLWSWKKYVKLLEKDQEEL